MLNTRSLHLYHTIREPWYKAKDALSKLLEGDSYPNNLDDHGRELHEKYIHAINNSWQHYLSLCDLSNLGVGLNKKIFEEYKREILNHRKQVSRHLTLLLLSTQTEEDYGIAYYEHVFSLIYSSDKFSI